MERRNINICLKYVYCGLRKIHLNFNYQSTFQMLCQEILICSIAWYSGRHFESLMISSLQEQCFTFYLICFQAHGQPLLFNQVVQVMKPIQQNVLSNIKSLNFDKSHLGISHIVIKLEVQLHEFILTYHVVDQFVNCYSMSRTLNHLATTAGYTCHHPANSIITVSCTST